MSDMNVCEYCKGCEFGNTTPISSWYGVEMLPEVFINGAHLYVCCDCGRCVTFSVNYCPMCGRKLDDE